ncbi:rRNA-processing protein and EBNA1-binding protein ebp2 [Nowakowskiella sp. JEL0078]|nr:rRNA-processing protein and EBNA1-binding protein ebp2 [Nowakowskiella sp. JEL0078]
MPRKIPKDNKRPRETGDGSDSIAAFIASQNLDDGLKVNPESLTFNTSGSKKKSNKKAMQEELDKIKKRKLRDVPMVPEDEEDDDSDEGFLENESEMDPEEEAELAAYLEMMDEKAPAESKKQKTEKAFYNNKVSMARVLQDLKLDVAWIETMVITSKTSTIPQGDPEETKAFVRDDLKRELAFLQQALGAAEAGRQKVLAAGVKFSRPDDYYAEMVKSDEHMSRIRQRLLDEQQQIMASEQARKMREAKKFGKKVQIEKQLERIKQKKSAMEKVTVAKRKRGSNGTVGVDGDEGQTAGDDDLFGVEVEKGNGENKKYGANKPKRGGKREHKDNRFGFGGRKRNIKSNTADSTDDLSGFSGKKMKMQALNGAKRKSSGSVQKKQKRK